VVSTFPLIRNSYELLLTTYYAAKNVLNYNKIYVSLRRPQVNKQCKQHTRVLVKLSSEMHRLLTSATSQTQMLGLAKTYGGRVRQCLVLPLSTCFKCSLRRVQRLDMKS